MKTPIRLRKEVSHGGVIPRGWRMAWYEPPRRIGVYYPAPLHWALRALREISYRIRAALRAPQIERAQAFELNRAYRERQRLADEYVRGYMCGWNECYEACLFAAEDESSGSGELWEIGESLTDMPKPSRNN